MEAYQDLSRSFEERALDLISRMTLEEKISQLSFDAPEIPRLGIRAWTWWNEASHGVLPVFQSFAEASSFPVCLIRGRNPFTSPRPRAVCPIRMEAKRRFKSGMKRKTIDMARPSTGAKCPKR